MPNRPISNSWYLTLTISAVDYVLSVMPVTRNLKGSISQTNTPWARQLLPELDRCNSFTFAKRGFSSSIGYLAFDLNQIVGGTTVGAILQAALDNRTIINLVMRYVDASNTTTDKTFYRLYGDSLNVYHTQYGGGAIGIFKLVDNRYYADTLAPCRNSTHTFTTYSSDSRATDLFYCGMFAPDWESSSASEGPTLYKQAAYWKPAFRDWTVTINNSSPLTLGGIPVSPQSETAYGCFKRIIHSAITSDPYFSDLQINSADGHATIVTNIPEPTNQALLYGACVPNGFYSYKSAASSALFEVLFPLTRKAVWNTESISAPYTNLFRLRYLSPYTQPTRVPTAAYLAYYPDGIPSTTGGTNECISILSDSYAIADRESGKANGPVGASITNADKFDFDYAALADLGDEEITKYLNNSKAYSYFQSQTIVGYADPYTFGATPNLICGARYTWTDVEVNTEMFWGVRFQVREQEQGLPSVGVAEAPAPLGPLAANLHQRQLGEQAFEELQLPYSSWTGHTEFKLYGHASYSAGDYTPVSTTTCDALCGVGEAKIVHARLDEDTGETNSLGIPENHTMVKSRDMIVGVNFVGYQMQDGWYRPIDQPSMRVAAVQSRWDTAVSPSVATASTDMHQKFLAPYFGQTNATTGNITDPTAVIAFDRFDFRVYDQNVQDNYIKTSFATTHCVNPSIAFLTNANRVMLAKTPSGSGISDGGSGTVELYNNTGSAVTWGPSSTKVTVTATSLFGAVSANKWCIIVEWNEVWYVINADC